MENRPPVTVTVSRQMGSGGTYIGYLLAKELGFRYLDREILKEAARYLGTGVSWVEPYDEKSPGIVENIIRAFSFGTPEMGPAMPPPLPVYEKDLFATECKVMNEIARRNSAVIVGRGGFWALRDRPGTLNVYVHAPPEMRIQRIKRVWKVSGYDRAREMIKESDRRRAAFIRDMTGLHWSDARNYHITFDTGLVDLSSCVSALVRIVDKVTQRLDSGDDVPSLADNLS
ncbi:MAG: hypothetical protein AVO39_01525 [delta proteobacterium MLS_D]|nr:MAG: hypothetical protein AVO39_01525 [delta proteobacterium MLS_D]